MAENSPTAKRRRFPFAAVAVVAVTIAGGTLAYAQHHGEHGHMSGGMAAEMHLDHMQAMLTRINATDAQKSQIDAILKGAMGELKTAHETHYAAFQRFHQLLLAPNVDRTQLETLRAGQVKLLDDESKRLVDAMVNAAEVLTPEQRAALVQEIRTHQGG